MRKLICTVFAAALVPASAFAQQQSDIRYSYLDIAYVGLDGGNESFTGLGVRGSMALNRDIFVVGEIASANTDSEFGDLDRTDFAVGIGYRTALNRTTDVFGRLDYLTVDMDEFGDDSGLRATAGVRALVAPQLELRGSVQYVDLTNADFVINLGAQFNFNDDWSGFAELSEGDDLGGYLVGARYHF